MERVRFSLGSNKIPSLGILSFVISVVAKVVKWLVERSCTVLATLMTFENVILPGTEYKLLHPRSNTIVYYCHPSVMSTGCSQF